MTPFDERIAEFARDRRLRSGCGPVAAAVSGGADSVALLLTLKAACDAGQFEGPLLCTHLHHQLRGSEADADMQFVVELANSLDVEVVTEHIDVRGYAASAGLSIETAGRNLRIERLTAIAASRGCTTIATGHHKDDNAETLIQRLARGTGYRGLCGIQPAVTMGSARFIRPLLCVRREEIEHYLRGKGYAWRQDRTNDDCAFRRNYIRHRLLPEIAWRCSGDIVEQLWRLSEAARGFRAIVDEGADGLLPRVSTIEEDRAIIRSMGKDVSRPVKIEILRRTLVALGIGERDLGRSHYRRLLELLDDTESEVFELPGRIRAAGGDLGIVLSRVADDRRQQPGAVQLDIGQQTQFGRFAIETRILDADSVDIDEFRNSKDAWVEWMDADSVSGPLIIRCRKQGDRFVPLGMSGEKKLGKFITAEKVATGVCRDMFVVADSEKILWLCPVRLSERVKVTAQTRRILEIRVRVAD